MKEYIERQKVIDGINDLFWDDTTDWEPWEIILMCHDMIAKIPAADVRPAVLCRDCKHRFMTPNGWHCHYAEWGIEDDDFCSCGEKREER